ncbi:hypothetical protein [Agrobacterium tumefaciens]|uniref:hypothetical protein n=1 Tax=Agrobacterium tumefaciens TaxID=358 RepID=UPI002856A46C|nr:hypothetical protein [Agrobacterium tumefaciens]MDR6587435.1 hypothetical protein [Agrobacterium tumefaciens]
MTDTPRKNHFGAKIAERTRRAKELLAAEPQYEVPEPARQRLWPPFDFERDLEQRIRDSEAGD